MNPESLSSLIGGGTIFETDYHILRSLPALIFHNDIAINCSLCLLGCQIPSSVLPFHPHNHLLNSRLEDEENKSQTGFVAWPGSCSSKTSMLHAGGLSIRTGVLPSVEILPMILA